MQRLTKQRKSVQELLSKFSTFLTVQEVHNELNAAGFTVGLSTVYRIIGEMNSSNEVDMVINDAGEAMYRLCSVEHHHHIICTNCGATVELFDAAIESWASAIAKENKFKLTGHSVELEGICSDCA
jgi:Fur family ferric uptake transcriptional regulator